MRKIHILTPLFFVIFLVGCAGSVKQAYVGKKYPPRSEPPIKFKEYDDAYLGGYVYFGHIKVKGEDETVALKAAAKYGAEGVVLSWEEIYSGGGSVPKYTDFPLAGGRIITGQEYVAGTKHEGFGVDMYRHDPSQAYTQGFRQCFMTDDSLRRYCRPDTVKELLSKGIDPNIPDSYGFTPLYKVVYDIGEKWSQYGGNVCLTAEILLDAGADPNMCRPTVLR